MITRFIAAVLAIGFVAVGFFAFRFLSAGPGSVNDNVVFSVRPGRSFHVIVQELQQQGLISSPLMMRILAKLTHEGGRVKVGEYALNRGMSPREILDVLVAGKSIQYPITFPEGSNVFEMAALIQNKGFFKADEFLKAVHDPVLIKELLGVDVSSLEGYLFPETYNLTKFTPLRELLAAMVTNFKNTYASLESQMKSQKPPLPLPRHDLVILASMVEKETGAPQERPMIASVFYNRLQKGMRLQSDPTIIYGIWVETGSYKNNITREDIVRPTRYNTYTVNRLPFGPIANPGRESLAAVMKPAQSEYFYFVSHNDGTHEFTKTYEEHTSAVKNFQLNPAARAGKSWRDLKSHANSN